MVTHKMIRCLLESFLTVLLLVGSSNGQTTCKTTSAGQEYHGTLTVTISGKPCQSWALQTPNQHPYTKNEMYPDGSPALAANRCRNPDPSYEEGPWCYTTDPAVRWEKCNVTLCSTQVHFCKKTDAGREFDGHLTITKSGLHCQSWAEQTPNAHGYTQNTMFPDGSAALAANRCRNPDAEFKEGPWCYTKDPNKRWEVCNVQLCGNETATGCKDQHLGDTFKGDIAVTRSGKQCQAWTSQSPQQHTFTKDSMFPDGSVAAAKNNCRNPGGIMPDGPWCFTTTSSVRWEYCNVRLCPAAQAMCKISTAGREFKGDLNHTRSGLPCQSWASQSPNAHNYKADSLYPDGSAAAAGNRCRNPDANFPDGPWCYTTDRFTPWELCNVRMCPSDFITYCKDTEEGREFLGHVTKSKSNKTCQAWSAQTPTAHTFTQNSMYPDGSVAAAGHWCRNPDPNNKLGPWCYVNEAGPGNKIEQCDVPLCPNSLAAQPPQKPCKLTQQGREFAGNVSVTKSGKQCQSWGVQFPNTHTFTTDSAYPDGSAAKAGARCRNPDPSYNNGPWCYTTDATVRWEDCDIPKCEVSNKTFCKETPTGRDFLGDLTVTKSNKTCQRWDQQKPVAHNFTQNYMFPDGSATAAGNKCRNPDPAFTQGPWCFTTDPNVRYELCDVPPCEKVSPTFCKTTQAGREFNGHLTVTKSGKQCQSWNSQSPNRHSYTTSTLFPEGSAQAADNRCRNPDASFNDGPWCYTMDPAVPWELCDVPFCPKDVENFCKKTPEGREFMGDLRETKSGRICQSWSSQTPNAHNFTKDSMFPDGTVAKAGGHCRNPDPNFKDGPWCFTNDPGMRWEVCDVPLCPDQGPSFCKNTREGRDFKGHLTVTKSGKQCQSWAEQKPNAHGFTADNLYPDGSAAMAGARCRNPDKSYNDGPWCYTTDPVLRWEPCDVPMCPNKNLTNCKETATGRDFKGDVSTTVSGKTCQRWDQQSPVKHSFNSDFMFPDGTVAAAGNRCRNPDPNYKGGPWCFTTDPNVSWEPCDIPYCEESKPSFCKLSQPGDEFYGHLSVTKSGKQCQSWAVQTPNAHPYKDDKLFPDGSVALAADRCRNPDPSYTAGPWCYTTDPSVPWEDCNVPFCPKSNETFCKNTKAGRDFMGNLRETKSGRICQSWSDQVPNKHNFTLDNLFPDGSVKLAGNKCRNPDSTFQNGPWCFTFDPKMPREECAVEDCPPAPAAYCRQTQAGQEFNGHLTVTKSGFKCQSWAAQTPNSHTYTDGKMFPDGSPAVADNRCRNPDPTFNGGPWCYTLDSKVRWEECDVPICSNQTFCKETPTGHTFTGDLRKTKSGLICQSWESQKPNAHNFTNDFMYPDGSVKAAGNRCRNPDPNYKGGPWCFTLDALTKWEECAVPLCQNAQFCKETKAGREFKGHLTVTKSGKTCQSWAAQSPNKHPYTDGTLYPDKSAELAGARCRNPDPAFNDGPWCYTTDPAVPWEICDVPMCTQTTSFCKKTKAGREFTGNLKETKSGHLCQSWNVQTPNKHEFTANALFPDGSAAIADNRCRNPDPKYEGGPWCYTTNPAVPREDCDVPMCPEEAPTFCKETVPGREFKGHLTVTKSGKLCQSWNSQTPNSHPYTSNMNFPDGSPLLADNRCRNPDPNFNDGPWCYTTDPVVKWETCDVPLCSQIRKDLCKKIESGREFKGNLRQTKSGKTCQRWDVQTPYAHNFTSDFMYADGSIKAAENMCRNPDPNFKAGPWCFTTDPTLKFEVCDVPMCPKERPTFCKDTQAGREFQGHLSVTKSGHQCQKWSEQTPNKHSYTSDSMYPDKNVTMAGGNCRNPDASFNDGPWCYTTNSSVPWEVCNVPFCPKDGDDFCKQTPEGRDFLGDLRETKSGRFCQAWSSQTPNKHNFTVDTMYPDKSVVLAENQCRNPDPKFTQGPWCYTMDPTMPWELCNVPACPAVTPSFCKQTIPGRDFKGHLTVTKSGRQCQSWAVQFPNRHTFTDDHLYPDGSALIAGNRCRNPDPTFYDGPWCYTTDPAVPWELCNVPMCANQTFCKETIAGREFKGDLRVTKSGKTCQSWRAQTPWAHNFTSEFMFPDASMEEVDNRCRNPDPTFPDGPWCFTTDPKTRLELCDVPICQRQPPSFCKETDAGREFIGHLTVTKSGKPCQSWAVQFPNPHPYNSNTSFPDKTVADAGNRCRNPDPNFNVGPWCYTTDPSLRWEECDVPACPKPTETFCKRSKEGFEFQGNLKESKSGQICQSWSSQTPHKHNFTDDKLFPDGSVLVAGNRCRNPDKNFKDGPWCFTTNPSIPREVCNVPMCPDAAPAFCKSTKAGREFAGHLTVTKSGKPCQSWAAQSPNKHAYTQDNLYPDGSAKIADNRCRNPDPMFNDGPWCYTTDPAVPWEICDVPECPKLNKTYCKESQTGRDFKGDLRQTKSGKTCQRWDLQTPVRHNFTSDFMFPDGTVKLAENMCRNPDPTYGMGPWCFTTDPNTMWEPCDVPMCDAQISFCKQTQAGREFLGHLTVTKSGKPCQAWDQQTPNSHTFTDGKLYPDGSAALAGNRCRNPDSTFLAGPWCYTTDPTVRWEECDVPFCPKENTTFCKSTEAGRDFLGNLRETKSGKICQSWTAQTPHVHNFTADKLFPDGSAKLADNRCRNPDPSFTKGPWCFTTDPATRWEECNVKVCDVVPTFCKNTIAGRDFKGHLTVTKSGKPCQSWALQTPNKHTYTTGSLYPDGSPEAAENRCRNPDPSFNDGPWCYTTDPAVPWEICDVQLCPKPEDFFCKNSVDGRDFTGKLSQTKTGRSCKTWASQDRTAYPFIKDTAFPDGSVANAGNMCRNPDPSITDGPWCFTTDPLVKWEYCAVPSCEKATPSFCKTTKAGREFKGHLAVTKSGKPCQSWAAQTPNPHGYTDGSLYPDGSAEAAGSRCRNPDSSFNDGPWCFTTDPTLRWEVCDVPICEVQNTTICKTSDAGREFKGNLRVTKSGYTCQAWNTQSPNTHTFTKDEMFPDGSAAAADNRCRNPDPLNNAGPWCYTTDRIVKQEQCDVPKCPQAVGPCKRTVGGHEFNGDVSKTKSGKTCQPWSVQSPNSHNYITNDLFPDGSVAAAGNKCRNPDKSFQGGPWCYTTTPGEWELCDIPACPSDASFCKRTSEGRDFKGHLTKTKSGLQCQSWATQSPNTHPFTRDSMYPDGSITLAADRCRNPDPAYNAGPWCYTTDPKIRWEDCDVPLCPDVNEIPLCKNTVAGRDFMGNLNKTASGFDCQRWDLQTPNPHPYTADNLYPDGSAAKAGGRCRNPDAGYADGPWCYTNDPKTRWEKCNVPLCDHAAGFCKTTAAGREFKGHLTKTIGGYVCQSWESQTPNAHPYTQDNMYADGTVKLAANRCRNPDPNYNEGPWCYTTDPTVRWQKCDVPMC